VLDELAARVDRVVIIQLREGTFYARVPPLGSPAPGQISPVPPGRFELLDTPPEDHFDVVLPDLEPSTVERLRACFLGQDNPARRDKHAVSMGMCRTRTVARGVS
jgi:hypothetical protein